MLILEQLTADMNNMTANKKIAVRSTHKIKVLIADQDRHLVRQISDFLLENGFDTRHAYHAADARSCIVNWKPDIALVDLMLPNGNAFEILHFVQTDPGLKNRDMKYVIMSSHHGSENMVRAFDRGANDYLKKPLVFADMLSRLVLHCRQKSIDITSANADAMAPWIQAELLVDQGSAQEPADLVLFHISQMVAHKMEAVRCSFVRVVTQTQGIVAASSDDMNVCGLPLDLTKYPEIQLVVNTTKMIAIENLEASRALKKIKGELRTIHFNSMIVCPVYYRGKIFGVISVRMPSERKRLTEEEVRFVSVAAKVASLALNAHDISKITKFGLISA